MKNLKKVLLVCLLLTSCIKSYSFTFLEILVGNVHKEMVIFVPDSLYHDQSNVLINTDIYGGVDLDTTLFSDQLTLSDTSYFEYLGYVIIDPSDSLGSIRHAYRLKTSFLSVPAAIELVYYDLSVLYNEEWIVQFSNMHKTCQTLTENCQNRYVSYIESILLPDYIYGSGGQFPIGGYDDSYAELDSDKQEVIRTVLNWINGTSHTIAEYSSLLDPEKFLWSDLPEGFCSDQSSLFACTNQTDLAIFMSDFISGLKEIPVPISDYDVFYEYTRLLRGFSAQCHTFGDYQVDVFTNADDTGYEIHLLPLLAGHPQIHAKVIFEGDSIYDKVAYAYRPVGRVGLNYDTLGSFSIVTYYQEANLQDECPFSPSVCLLPAGLTANRDTLHEGEINIFTASPLNQPNYQFYINNELFQDSSTSNFKTFKPKIGDSLTVTIKNIDGCISSKAITPIILENNMGCLPLPEESDRSTCMCGTNINGIPQGGFPENSEKYYRHIFYRPDENNNFIPTKKIKINIIILQRINAVTPIDNFPDNSSTSTFLHKVFDNDPSSVQNIYLGNATSNPANPCLSISNELLGARINFELENILFLPVDDVTFDRNYCNYDAGIYQKAVDYFGCSIEDNLNYFLVKNFSCDQAVGRVSNYPTCNMDDVSYIISGTFYAKYLANLPDGDSWGFQRHAAHELGHFLDLFHTFGTCADGLTTDFDYLSDVYCPSNPCPITIMSNNNLMNGSFDHYNYTPLQVAKMHRALSLKNIRKYVDDCPYSSEPIIVNKNETWNIDFRVFNDIVVRSGYTLTIQCRVLFPDQASLIVEPGARLIIDGGNLTSACYMWRGIKLMGLSNQLQGTVNITVDANNITINNINTTQGLIITNNALIENAEEAIFMSAEDGNMYNGHTGGIVKAFNTTFKNNFRSVAFHPYRYNSISTFNNCHFLCDKHLNDPVYRTVDGPWLGSRMFVSIWDVRNIRFIDNTFENSINYEIEQNCSSTSYTWPRDNRTIGITTYDARFYLIASDESLEKRNKFIGLTRGVDSKVTSGISGRNIFSRGSKFDNVQMGIYSQDGLGDQFYNNVFNIPDASGNEGNEEDPRIYGMYLHNYRNMVLRNNTFEGSGASNPYNWGLIVQGPGLNQVGIIERNDFTNLHRGFQAQKDNPRIKLTCNEFTGNVYEWQINPIASGVFGNQGVGCATAVYRPGNVFNDQGSGEKHIWSQNISQTWHYYARDIASIENPIFAGSPIYGQADPCFGNLPDPCPSGVGARLSHDLNAMRHTQKDEMDTLQVHLATLIASLDGGQTDSLLLATEDEFYGTTALTAMLNAASPLSNTVLISLLSRDSVLNDAQLLDVMSKNLPVADHVLTAIDDLFTTSPYLKATQDSIYLLQAYNPYVETATQITRSYEWSKGEWLRTIMEMELAYLEDDEYGSLIAFYKDSLGAGFERNLLGAYLGADSLANARSLLDSLPLADIDDSLFVNFHSVFLDLKADSLSWMQMDMTQKNAIQTIANTSSSVQGYAIAVLELIGDTLILNEPELNDPPSAKLALASGTSVRKPIVNTSFSVFPNPNGGNFTILFNDATVTHKIVLDDLAGRTVQQSTSQGAAQVQLSVPDLSRGIYFCSVYVEGIFKGTERVVVIK